MLQFWLGWPNLPQHGYGHRNRRQWITKLVRENREELILPPVGFSKRLLGTPALADISKHEHDAGRDVIRQENRRRTVIDRDFSSILRDEDCTIRQSDNRADAKDFLHPIL